jgi:hypothetical protein
MCTSRRPVRRGSTGERSSASLTPGLHSIVVGLPWPGTQQYCEQRGQGDPRTRGSAHHALTRSKPLARTACFLGLDCGCSGVVSWNDSSAPPAAQDRVPELLHQPSRKRGCSGTTSPAGWLGSKSLGFRDRLVSARPELIQSRNLINAAVVATSGTCTSAKKGDLLVASCHQTRPCAGRTSCESAPSTAGSIRLLASPVAALHGVLLIGIDRVYGVSVHICSLARHHCSAPVRVASGEVQLQTTAASD